jgi:hypothetical protein
MFEIWKLNRALKKAHDTYHKKRKVLAESDSTTPDDYAELEADDYYHVQDIEKAIECELSDRLCREARSLDVELPAFKESGLWLHDGEIGRTWLKPEGREHLRTRIYNEKARKFEVKTLWATKLIIPLASLLIGIIGALTGLFAVLHKK